MVPVPRARRSSRDGHGSNLAGSTVDRGPPLPTASPSRADGGALGGVHVGQLLKVEDQRRLRRAPVGTLQQVFYNVAADISGMLHMFYEDVT